MQFHFAERGTFCEAPCKSFGCERSFERRARKGDKALFVRLTGCLIVRDDSFGRAEKKCCRNKLFAPVEEIHENVEKVLLGAAQARRGRSVGAAVHPKADQPFTTRWDGWSTHG